MSARSLVWGAVFVASAAGARVRRSASTTASSCTQSASGYKSMIDSLLQEREGYGKDAQGGEDGEVFIVDTSSDTEDKDDCGCCLRKALEEEGDYWVIFSKDMDIKLKKRVNVESYKTIDGRGRSITIKAPDRDKVCEASCDKNGNNCQYFGWTDTAFRLEGKKHIIFSDLTFEGDVRSHNLNWKDDGECSDAIYMSESQHIWIHHNKFQYWADSAVEVREENNGGSLNKYVTITDNHITKINQAFVMSATMLSFGRNWCDGVRKRCIKVSYGKAHSYNNVIEGWKDRSIQNVVNGQLLSDNNMFIPDGYNDVGKMENGSNRGIRCNDNCDDWGSIDWCNEDGKCSSSNSCSQEKQISESYYNESRGKVAVQGCGASLRDTVRDNAGPREDWEE